MIGDINENFLHHSQFKNYMKGKGCYQMVDKPTCETGSLLDQIYVNDALNEMGFSIQVNSCYYSDHDIVSLCLSKQK